MRILAFVVIVLVALAIYFIVRAIQERSLRKFSPDIKTLESGETEVIVINGRGNAAFTIDTIENDLPDYEREAEMDIAWERAERFAKDLNDR